MNQWNKEYTDILKGIHAKLCVVIEGMCELREAIERLEATVLK